MTKSQRRILNNNLRASGRFYLDSLEKNLMSSIFRLTILLLFFISGVTGLIYEVTWTRMFTTVFGNTTYAVSAVLTAFMGGLALGSFVIGRFVDKKHQLLKIYAILEVGIGLTALAMPWILQLMNDVYVALYRLFPNQTWILMIVKVVISLTILLIPTFLMGGTLPVLSKFFIRRIEQSGTHVAILYAMNTIGATIGCFLTGFLLIEFVGIIKSIQISAIINFILAIIFFALGIVITEKKVVKKKHKEGVNSAESTLQKKYIWLVLIGYAIAGFVSLSYEVLWTRLLVFKLNTTVYAFTIMLTTFLAGIGLGSLIFSVIEKIGLVKHHYKTFGVIESLIGLFGLISILLFGSFEYFSTLWDTVSWRELITRQILLAGLIMIVPTILMGIAFPVVSRIYTQNIKKVGTSIGSIYSVNTIGGIIGSFLTGFLIVETIGTQNSIIFISLIVLCIGSLILMFRPRDINESSISKRSSLIFIPLSWFLAILFIIVIPGDFLFQYYNIGEKQVDNRVEILYAHEGVECITTVHRYPDGNRVISTGSINVAGTDFTLRTTQKLQAHIPMLIHTAPKDVLQVGFGSGETGYILTTYDTEHVNVVEISRGVLETSSKYFTNLNHNVMNHPKFKAIIMDGANYIAITDRKFDVIMNDSIWPYYAGNSGLYTREYFEDCRDHLKVNGIMTSWLPVELPEKSFKTLLKTFHSVFPHVSLWMAVTHYNKHALIVGSLKPLKIDLDLFLKRFNQFAKEDLKIVNLDDPVFFLDSYKMNETGFMEWVESAPLHTINKPILEFAPRMIQPSVDRARSYELISNSSMTIITHLANFGAFKESNNILSSLNSAYHASQHLMYGLIKRERGMGNFIEDFKLALKQKPNHPGALYLIGEFEHLRTMKLTDLESIGFNDLLHLGETFLENNIYEKAITVFKKAVQIRPNSSRVHYNLGTSYYRQGSLDLALMELNKALELKSNYSPAYNMRGLIYYSKNEHSIALDDFSRAIKFNPEYALAFNNRGITFSTTGEFREALYDFNQAINLNPYYAEAYYNRGLVYQSGHRNLGLDEDSANKNAISNYTSAITLDPTYTKAYHNRGMINALNGKYSEAIADFNYVIKLNPEQADGYYNRGLACYLSGNVERARKDFAQALKLDSSYRKKLNNLKID